MKSIKTNPGKSPFVKWLDSLKDVNARAAVVSRLDRLAPGNFGDCKRLLDKLYELRISYGPGYRVYFARKGNKVVIILSGGHKSAQDRDIRKCLRILRSDKGGGT
ncbi:MAG: type II toxin-antitoxin system RelE/ParE family toxin [Nitrospinae bacterium]|nr:type II toxin-antitoxin system RelE/ParE family toxin [Nitrospinota bacterium]